jgi:radical SAM protein with 4Fe4S-binding SPASM domain
MLIDYDKLNSAYSENGFYALQLEVGDLCYQKCIYCYMNALDTSKNTLSDEQIKNILKDSSELDITAIEWLGGEPLLRKSIFEYMALAADLGFRNNIWTGGLPLSDESLAKNSVKYAKVGLIAIHVSTINPNLYLKLHLGAPKNDLNKIIDNTKRLLDLGYPNEQILNSVTFTGLQSAEDMIETIDYFEEEFGIKASLNVYHTYLRPGFSNKALEKFIPSTDEVKKVYSRYAKQWGVNEFPMNCVNKQYCSATFAVLCDGSVTPCATIRENDAPTVHSNESLYEIVNKNRAHLNFGFFRNSEHLPPKCRECNLSDQCFGCRSRSFAAGNGIYGMDPRCFK